MSPKSPPSTSKKSAPKSLFKEHFEKEVVGALQKTLGLKNHMAVPRVKAVKVNVGIGSYVTGGKDFEDVVKNITLMTGQKPVVAKAKQAISNFKLKIGMETGVSVTLRGKRMYDFLSKLVNVIFPRIRDFRGISKKSFDGQGNYSVGLKEHMIFPEINADDITKTHGLQVTIVTSAKDNKQGYELLKALNFPFKKD